MAIRIVRFLSMVLSGVMAGMMVNIRWGSNPASLSAQAYVELHQALIKSYNTFMPLLGLVVIVLIVISAVQQRSDKPARFALAMAAVLMIASGLITRFGNQPINALVATWLPAAPPANWMALRDEWLQLHVIRTVATLLACCLVVWTVVRKKPDANDVGI